MARPRRPLLSRARIIAAALELIDAEGLTAVSTRRLATVLGVQGPSLYNHVGTKDELIDAVVDTVLSKVDTTMFDALGPGNRDWRTALDRWARAYRDVITAHPNVVPALASGPGRRPHALRMADAVYGGLLAAGWPRPQATSVAILMRYFITGSALGSFAAGFPADTTVYAADYPNLNQAHLLADRESAIARTAFDTGLTALLDGLEARYAAATAEP
ncbi:TetR/AcrR family transcriptional regulator [Nocardia huaxiensis]|uniref:TetR/AcrR family transcriptional regulator n=1 Tax=Nocardia huaxiensis TaxID=2755382 RepID=UPI001E2E0D87|nr:TetR/AcrR family transcriptional regulator C-terminal domain-containing protein [Nocardia huaxiensis]UFS98120.1 TetR/AcrR family transcriptional regulator C-terminal domain-containing protein [Nocardia huaxiensis]